MGRCTKLIMGKAFDKYAYFLKNSISFEKKETRQFARNYD